MLAVAVNYKLSAGLREIQYGHAETPPKQRLRTRPGTGGRTI